MLVELKSNFKYMDFYYFNELESVSYITEKNMDIYLSMQLKSH